MNHPDPLRELPHDVGKGCWSRVGVWGTDTLRCPLLADLIHCKNCTHFVAGGRELFDRPWEGGQSSPEETSPDLGERGNQQSALAFRLGDEVLGLDLGVLSEVAPYRSALVHHLPRRQGPVLRGIYNLHGRLIPLVSLGGLLGVLPSQERSTAAYLVVLAFQGEKRLAFPVTELLGTHPWRTEQLLEPSTHSGRNLIYIRGLLPFREHRLGLLRADRVLEGFAKALHA